VNITGLPKAASFGIEADGSIALPLARWLHEYLGMVPAAVRLREATAETRSGLDRFLAGIDCLDARDAPVHCQNSVRAEIIDFSVSRKQAS
jgi:hypothetical protein